MKSFERTALQDLALLCFIAGSADAAGFLGLGHIFTSNMTGNVVLLGIALGQGDWPAVLRIAYVVGMFMIGVAIGTSLGRKIDAANWRQLALCVISVEALLLTLFAAFWCWLSVEGRLTSAYALTALLALAMGLQAAAMNRLSLPGVATTAVTGTLTSFTSGLLLLFTTPANEGGASRQRIAYHALVLALYGGGAVLSGTLMLHFPWSVGFLPAALCLFIFLRHLRS